MQDALIRAWRELPTLRDPDRFVPWLRRIVVNRCRDVARTERRITRVSIDGVEAGAVPDFAPQLDHLTDLSAAIQTLTVDHRSILALHYLLGLSIHETARSLEIPDGTAKSRLSAALGALRLAMADAP